MQSLALQNPLMRAGGMHASRLYNESASASVADRNGRHCATGRDQKDRLLQGLRGSTSAKLSTVTEYFPSFRILPFLVSVVVVVVL